MQHWAVRFFGVFGPGAIKTVSSVCLAYDPGWLSVICSSGPGFFGNYMRCAALPLRVSGSAMRHGSFRALVRGMAGCPSVCLLYSAADLWTWWVGGLHYFCVLFTFFAGEKDGTWAM